MKISLTEIWNFIELIKTNEKGWEFGLHAGNVSVSGLKPELLTHLKNDDEYDTEILPSIFTFREILWQPDVFTEAKASLPGLRILNAYCEEIAEELKQNKSETGLLYATLISGIGECCRDALTDLEKGGTVTKILGDFRVAVFPIVKFFIFHPKNRKDYYKDAVNRLNYAVKVILTQFHGRYTALEDPYWQIQFDQGKGMSEIRQSPEQKDIISE